MTTRVGAASRSVLPLVDGRQEYLDRVPGPEDAFSPGALVTEWDDGTIAVGNGDERANWVRDDLRARALAVDDGSTLVVLIALDLYMLFAPDVEALRERVADRLPDGLDAPDEVLVACTHVHSGPDTAFRVNHDWFGHMLDRAADAVIEAIANRQPAMLHVGAGEHYFGIAALRDPRIIDGSMNVLQARALEDDAVIATLVQWNNHPEVTLEWEPRVDPADLAALGEGEDSNATDRVFTADYPGHVCRVVSERVGGETLLVNGPLGGMMTPLTAPVWEVDDEHPIDEPYAVPEGARLPGGVDDPTEANYRRAAVIGEQAALAALRIVGDGQEIDAPSSRVEHEPFFARISNIGLRFLGVVDDETGRPAAAGHRPRPLYRRENGGYVADDFEVEADPLVGAPRRVGDHARSEVVSWRIGPVGMMFIPGEMQSHLAAGFPADFDEHPERYYEHPEDHAVGKELEIPGYVKARMPDRYRWVIGLGNDELGYIMPIADWRVLSAADVELLGGEPGAAARLHEAGVLSYPDSLSGEECKHIVEDPERALARYPDDANEVMRNTAVYGQGVANLTGTQARNHYEEINATSWDIAEDVLAAVARLTGIDDDTRLNPELPGLWPGKEQAVR